MVTIKSKVESDDRMERLTWSRRRGGERSKSSEEQRTKMNHLQLPAEQGEPTVSQCSWWAWSKCGRQLRPPPVQERRWTDGGPACSGDRKDCGELHRCCRDSHHLHSRPSADPDGSAPSWWSQPPPPASRPHRGRVRRVHLVHLVRTEQLQTPILSLHGNPSAILQYSYSSYRVAAASRGSSTSSSVPLSWSLAFGQEPGAAASPCRTRPLGGALEVCGKNEPNYY